MRRILCITGLLFFAVLIGDTAGRLQRLYKEGILFEQYNSQRKSVITLFSVSIFGLATLGAFEISRSRRRFERRGFVSMNKGLEPVVDGLGETNIYDAPEAVDKWQGRNVRIPKSRHRQVPEMSGLWMGVLRVYCVVLPVLYLYTLVNYLFFWLPSGAGNWLLSILFPVLFLGSALTSAGILRKRTWGIHFGYFMAIFHLLIFPLGTAVGLVMLFGLLGVTSEFAIPERKRRRKALRKAMRKARRKRLKSATV